MKAKRLFAADLGASGGKCFSAEFGADSFTMQEIHRFEHEAVSFHVASRDGEISERMHWDDVLLYRNILTGLQTYRREIADELDAVGIDTWGADGQFLSADGETLGHVYCYRDHRLDDMIAEVQRCLDGRRIYEITGIQFERFNVSNQLRWFVTKRSDLLRPGCFFLPIPSLFTYYLGGVRKVDSCWASVTQLMDARTRQWSAEMLESLAIPAEVLPEIVEPGTVVGELSAPVAEEVGLNRARLVAVASHDTASAFAAAPVDRAEDALIVSSGTWSLVGKIIPSPITSETARKHNISNEGGIGYIRFLKNCMGTWPVQELRRAWRREDGKESSWPELVALAGAAPAFTAFIDPDDETFYNPSDMAEAILAFCRKTGQPPPPDRGTMLRVVYDSLALQYRRVAEQLREAGAGETRIVHVVGGGSRNEMLNQATADALGVPVVAGPEEATAVGNVLAQAMGLGLIGSMRAARQLIRQTFALREYAPKNPEAWQAAYPRFRRACGDG